MGGWRDSVAKAQVQVFGNRILEIIEETVEPRNPNIPVRIQVEGAMMSCRSTCTSRGMSDPSCLARRVYQIRILTGQILPTRVVWYVFVQTTSDGSDIRNSKKRR